jgi:hypothetical protein
MKFFRFGPLLFEALGSPAGWTLHGILVLRLAGTFSCYRRHLGYVPRFTSRFVHLRRHKGFQSLSCVDASLFTVKLADSDLTVILRVGFDQ